jgi:hypothetical protein
MKGNETREGQGATSHSLICHHDFDFYCKEDAIVGGHDSIDISADLLRKDHNEQR